jgi:hypothetical protein
MDVIESCFSATFLVPVRGPVNIFVPLQGWARMYVHSLFPGKQRFGSSGNVHRTFV